MRVIIVCAGKGERWGNYLGVSKHFVSVDGEKLLFRTVRQFKTEEIIVVGNSLEYKIDGASLYIPNHNQANSGADKLLNSKCLWSSNERNLVIFGDVYFTDDGLKKIFEYTKREWAVFGRMNASKVTGCDWGEIFGFSFYGDHINKLEDSIRQAVDLFLNGYIKRCQGWEIYRVWAGIDARVHAKDKHFIEIDDFTEDFDYPKDYETWKVNKDT